MPYLQLGESRFHYHLHDFTDPWQTKSVVLLHHAAGGNLHRWRAWVPTLARHYRVVRFDMRGHAGTDGPINGIFSLSELAADITSVMDNLEIDKIHLVGASAGGIVSLKFAHDFQDRIHSLSLVASTPKLAQMGAAIDASVWRRTLEEQGTRAWLASNSQERFGPNSSSELVDWYASSGDKTSPEMVLGLQGCLLAEDLTPLLENISAPTLILGAEHDEITPMEAQNLMAEKIPNATLHTFQGVGHNMKVEAPDLLSGTVLDFIRKIESE